MLCSTDVARTIRTFQPCVGVTVSGTRFLSGSINSPHFCADGFILISDHRLRRIKVTEGQFDHRIKRFVRFECDAVDRAAGTLLTAR